MLRKTYSLLQRTTYFIIIFFSIKLHASASAQPPEIKRKRLKLALFECLEENPGDFSLKRLSSILDQANLISTIDQYGNTLLHYAAGMNHGEAISFLIQRGCELNEQNIWGSTPLHLAVASNRIIAVKKLLSENADQSIENQSHRTPQDLASEMGHQEILQYLQEKALKKDSRTH